MYIGRRKCRRASDQHHHVQGNRCTEEVLDANKLQKEVAYPMTNGAHIICWALAAKIVVNVRLRLVA